MGDVRCRGAWPVVIRAALIAVLLALHAAPVRAQDGTPELEPDAAPPPQETEEPEPPSHIYGQTVDVLFPAAVHFDVYLDVPLAEVQTVRLTLRQPTGADRLIPLDPPEAYAIDHGEGYTILRYVWSLPDEPALTPFEPLTHVWRVETADGQLSTREDEFVYADLRYEPWYTAGMSPLVLHWHRPQLAGDRLQGELFATYDLLARRAGVRPTFRFAIYEASDRLCDTVTDEETGEALSVVEAGDGTRYPCSPEEYTALYARSGVTFVQRRTPGFTDLKDQLIAEMVRGTYAQLWGDADVPAWFQSGLGGLVRQHGGFPALELVRAVAADGMLLDPADLAAFDPEEASAPERAIWEAASFLLVLYLADEYGAEAPFDLARAVGPDGIGFDAALADLTGGDLAALWGLWRAWLDTPGAAQAANWTPYQPTTPTPTVTPTPTPVTPTPVPTVTPTPTSTATPTPLGVPPATVAAPERTPIRLERPTNTPLPPGSLPTVTTVAEAVPAGEDGDAEASLPDPLLLGGIAVAASVGLLILVAGVITSRRR